MGQYSGSVKQIMKKTMTLREAEAKGLTLNEFLDHIGAIAISISISKEEEAD